MYTCIKFNVTNISTPVVHHDHILYTCSVSEIKIHVESLH